ncbi:1-phosphatidylinositol-3-phosphate 5-kinase FAB1B-like isoform X1 [Salvia splendens]|uniref:1-phosphatidylinositol-3-phosphate 5-kinase FAB1B-like isoform X1 n=1 Tax=Salvia splendens TaxID=180675 RepID=UPI001C265961|nr:1-phosphatidylinositol-3-phosphate 5-kinase FAB1B-like isoform X1 [Salvia splendens]
MDDPDRTFPDLVGLFKSWMSWRSEPAHVSRDFWMPDQSCRVCYECDSQFTLFNRRHHCRLCGRIFCAKCTSNWLPVGHSEPKISLEERDKIRVCNYCFKQSAKDQWGKELSVAVDDGLQVDLPDASCTSPSTTSFLSTRSSGTCGSSTTFVSVPQSAGPTPMQSLSMEADLDRQNVGAAKINVTEEQNLSDDQFDYFRNRSDDEDDEFGISQLGPIASDFSQVNGYYGPVKFEDINSDYNSRKVHPDGDAVDSKSTTSSPLRYSLNSRNSEESQQIAEKDAEHDIGDECEAPSSLYVAEDVNTEPVDFENNGVLWLPPEPEDEDDEREALVFEDDGDGDAAGEWGYLNNSSSSGSGEFRSREKSIEEHKRAMKSVVEGHFRALVAQLLQVDNLLSEDENDKESWLEIIIALSWEAATFLKPDMSQGGQMDPGGYVKVKCLASGLRSESLVVRGVVCKKNVAHRRMTSRVEKPRLVILGGVLEYQRVSNALSSFDTLLQQEMDHLKMAVAKISVHTPNILLVEKSVSRYAQEYLLAKEISLVLNIKRPLLERIARCTGAQIVPSIDHLSSEKVGYCDMFNVMRFTEEHGSAGQAGKKLVKTLMYFEGCPKPQGCTIILRGASGDELKKVKHVVQYGVFAAYHLALETSFLADEGASLPALPLNSPITVALPDKQSTIDRSISTVPGFSVPSGDKTPGPQSVGDLQRSNTLPPSDLIRETIASIHEYSDTHNIPAPLSSQYGEPPISSCVDQHSSSNPLSAEDQAILDLGLSIEAKPSELNGLSVAAADIHSSNQFGDSNVKIIDSKSNGSNLTSLQTDALKISDEQPALKEEFPPSPSDHQSILVSLSSRCVWKGTVCERSHLFRIKYYGSFDKPLGRYLRDHLFDQSFVCRSCEMASEAHVQCYTHRQGTLTISVKKLPEIILPGEREGKIWMWHRCLRCPRANGYPPATRRVLMSDAAWGLSFGKFLELSFSNHAAASRVASCGHSLHRDCLRFYGFGQMVACFRYASIDVHSVYLPPSKLDFNYKNQEWIEKEMNEVVGRAELLFSEVLNALRLLAERKSSAGAMNGVVNVHESRHLIIDLEGLLQKEKSMFEEMLRKIMRREARIGQPLIDILELNRLRRELAFQSYVWDQRLIYAASLDSSNKPNKVEVSTSEAVQKILCETERLQDVNVLVPTSNTLSSLVSAAADAKLKENPDHGKVGLLYNHLEVIPQRTDLSSNPNHGDQNPLEPSHEVRSADKSDALASSVNVHKALLDGQTPISLSDTLDAAWTGESNPGVGVQIKCSVPELTEVDTSSAVRGFDKLDMEYDREELPSFLSTNNSGDVDDSESWLTTPFSIYHRSPSKNCSGLDLKLDVLGGYDPVYISSFQDPELQGGARLLLPVGINETVIPVYDDEPTSLISYALVSHDYFGQISDEPEKSRDTAESFFSMQSLDAGSSFQSFSSLDEVMLESYKSLGSGEESMLMSFRNSLNSDPVSYTKALHARVSFTDDGPLGKVKYTVTCYYAKRFDALRRICCPSEMDFVRSLSRCKKWGAQGGKSNVFFAKTLDDRFIIKQVTKTELESFIKFAPGYFKYLSESIGTGSPTCLAKILGIYQVSSKHLKGGKETKMDVLVMENLLFGRNMTRLYDLKGSSRSRYNPDSSGSNKVLLDQNLIEAMPTSPIFVGNKAKRVLERAVWNDTAFLASIDVMDYSLLVGVDEQKHELVLGIIDFMRQYTWDKHLETWVKASGILGGPKNASPTVISPKQYKRRFRKAMTTYFLMVPDQWSPPMIIRSQSQTEMAEEKSQSQNTAHDYMPSA